MGYAGNATPQYIIPTAIASREGAAGSRTGAGQQGAMSDLDFHIGDDVRYCRIAALLACSVCLELGLPFLQLALGSRVCREASLLRGFFCYSPLLRRLAGGGEQLGVPGQLPDSAWPDRELGQHGALVATLHV